MYKEVSTEFKRGLDEALRNRMFLQVSLGVIHQDAQTKGQFDPNDLTEWSNAAFPWRSKKIDIEYATYEENYFKADGSMRFIPEGENAQFDPNVGVTAENIGDAISVSFPAVYGLKGLTLDFGRAYPTKFSITTDNATFTYNNDSSEWSTTDNLGNTQTLTITPITMVGGAQRLRINHILMGVGLNYTNSEIQSMTYDEKNNSISLEVPSANCNLTIADPDEVYDVDKIDSFINYLQTGQEMTMSLGMELDNHEIEYVPLCNLLLSTWSAKKGVMTFNAVDRFELMDVVYENGYTIAARTLYAAAEVVLQFMGLEPDEYIIDDCLRDVTIHAPLPQVPCRELLQLIANAGRCILYQDRDGKVVFKANFGNVLDPEDIEVTGASYAAWSTLQNVTKGATDHYAEYTPHYFKADGSMRFMPASNYLRTTGYVSALSDENGDFEVAPKLRLSFPAGFIYYGMTVVFAGNPPPEMQIKTYYQDELVQTVTVNNCEEITHVQDTFNLFDEMVLSFPRTSQGTSRVLVDRVTFGNLTDYSLTYDNIIGDVTGLRETKVKDVSVKVYSYENLDGEPQQVNDNVVVTQSVNTTGKSVVFTNPLIDSQALAEQVGEWLAFYYSNNVSYTLDYRGDPRLNASDLVFLESPTLNNLQAEIESHKLTFDGSLRGSMELRRAIHNTAD